jgi:glycogen debranching enzyme
MTTEQRERNRTNPGGERPASREVPAGLNSFYIVAPSPLADENRRVLKHGETFAVFDHYGDITPGGLGEEGIYFEGTRFLSCLLLQLGADRPLFLRSTIKEENDLLAVDMTNPDARADGRIVIPRGTLHIFRAKFLWHGVCYERIRIRNYGLIAVNASLTLRFQADFADIFEVRGTVRQKRGRQLPPRLPVTAGSAGGSAAERTIVLAYEGLDGVVRQTRLEFSLAPSSAWDSGTRFDLLLPPGGEATLFVTVSCEVGERVPALLSFENAREAAENSFREARAVACGVDTTNERFNAWLSRTVVDLHMMVTATKQGPYPYAGVPWFSTIFGRDGIITALECLWINPEMARGVLAYLAALQARAVIPEQDAEPGKILHEARLGEMAELGEIPFGRYYGSVDSTPLFVMLAGAYYQRTADVAFLASLWPNIELALQWIDTYGDADGDGFVEYARHSSKGLIHQGWKDSHDAIFHADGSLANGPIALCEVQGYVYAAKRWAALLATTLGHTERARELARQADTLQQRFEQTFWCEELSTYALALDGNKRLCRVRTSNAGHCLFTGIASQEHGLRVGQTLLTEDSFSGWGIRTVAATESRYNPMSYHNGSVWPHDNALIAQGLARYGLMDGVLKVMTGLYNASLFVDLHRLPELFCGFIRRPGEGPTLYPVACAPQSWSAASLYLLLQACLGLDIRATEGHIFLHHPSLPEFLREVRIRNLQLGEATVDLLLRRHKSDVAVEVLRKEGSASILLTKTI